MDIHYIFLDIGLKKLEEREDYLDNIEWNTQFYPNYTIWGDKEIELLIDEHYGDLKDRICKMPKYYLIDFARPLILNIHGGFYCDMDIRINKPIPNDRDFLHSLYTYPKTQKTILGNSLFKLPKNLYYPFIIYCLNEFDRVSNIKVYETWKYRKLLQSVGGYALKRFCKKACLELNFAFYDFCREYNTASVLEVSSNKKGYGAGYNYND